MSRQDNKAQDKLTSNRYEDRSLNFVYTSIVYSIFFPPLGLLAMIAIFFRKKKASELSKVHYQWAMTCYFAFVGSLFLAGVVASFSMPAAMLIGMLAYIWFTVTAIQGLMRYIDGKSPTTR